MGGGFSGGGHMGGGSVGARGLQGGKFGSRIAGGSRQLNKGFRKGRGLGRYNNYGYANDCFGDPTYYGRYSWDCSW
jgi:hypothetical protein